MHTVLKKYIIFTAMKEVDLFDGAEKNQKPYPPDTKRVDLFDNAKKNRVISDISYFCFFCRSVVGTSVYTLLLLFFNIYKYYTNVVKVNAE